jgi:hypothetical protein
VSARLRSPASSASPPKPSASGTPLEDRRYRCRAQPRTQRPRTTAVGCQLATVAQALLDGAIANGFTGALWTLDRIAIVIERLTGVRRHSVHVWALLHYRLGDGAAMMTSTLRVSNAKAKADLGWEPSVPTYREGIARVVEGWRIGQSPAEGPA